VATTEMHTNDQNPQTVISQYLQRVYSESAM